MGKIVTPKNFNLKLCIRDYVGEATHHANFGSNRYSGGFPPYMRYYHFATFFTVLSCPGARFSKNFMTNFRKTYEKV